MRTVVQRTVLLSLAVLLSACASTVPPSRLGDYLSTEKTGESESVLMFGQRPFKTGLVLIPDTTDPEAAPALPEEALLRLGHNLKQDLERTMPLTISDVIPTEGIRPRQGGDAAQFAEVGRRRGWEYLAIVVVSSTEQEYPVYVFLGWTTHMQPGSRTDNWSLLEFALLDVKDGKTTMRSEGRGWATLDRPTAPGIDQWYPVVYLRPQDPERHFWPPTYDGAPNTLRVVSFNQAARRLTGNLLREWRRLLEEKATTPHSG